MMKKNAGFTLVEVVMASGLLCLLVAASFIAVSSVMHAARAMSQRVSAQCMCTALLEAMKGLPYDNLASGDAIRDEGVVDYISIKAQDIVANGLGPGCRNISLSYEIEQGDGTPNRKNVRITCTWEFTDRIWRMNHAKGTHTEVLEAVLTDRYSTSTERKVLNVVGLKLNPNCNLSAEHKSYTVPAKLRIIDTDGRIWTQQELSNGNMPESIAARSVEIFPGGGGELQYPYTNFPKLSVNNSKTYSYYSKNDSMPIVVSIYKSNDGIYRMNMNCDDATVNIE